MAKLPYPIPDSCNRSHHPARPNTSASRVLPTATGRTVQEGRVANPRGPVRVRGTGRIPGRITASLGARIGNPPVWPAIARKRKRDALIAAGHKVEPLARMRIGPWDFCYHCGVFNHWMDNCKDSDLSETEARKKNDSPLEFCTHCRSDGHTGGRSACPLGSLSKNNARKELCSKENFIRWEDCYPETRDDQHYRPGKVIVQEEQPKLKNEAKVEMAEPVAQDKAHPV